MSFSVSFFFLGHAFASCRHAHVCPLPPTRACPSPRHRPSTRARPTPAPVPPPRQASLMPPCLRLASLQPLRLRPPEADEPAAPKAAELAAMAPEAIAPKVGEPHSLRAQGRQDTRPPHPRPPRRSPLWLRLPHPRASSRARPTSSPQILVTSSSPIWREYSLGG